jgi:hypothetical protein
VNNRKWKYEKSENIKIKIKRNKEVLIYEIKKLELLK